MGILVCYDDFSYDVIEDEYHLHYLLEKGCIKGYDNCGRWVKTEDDGGEPEELEEIEVVAHFPGAERSVEARS